MSTPAAAAALVHSSEDAIIGLTLEGIVTSWNPAAERLYGFSASEIVGYRLWQIMPDDLHDVEMRRIARVVEGSAQRVANTARLRRDGTPLVVSSSMFPIRDERYRITAVGLIERDVTESIAMQASLLQAKRMEIVGRLAGGVAQEFNNINTAILGFVDFVVPHVGDNAAARADLDAITAAAMRGARLAGHLLAFGGERGTSLGTIAVNDSLRSLEPLLQRLASERIWVTLDLDPSEPVAAGDESQFELIVFELLMRAADALGSHHGTVMLKTRRVSIDETAFPTPAGVPTGNFVELALCTLRATEDEPSGAVPPQRIGDWDFSELGMAMVVSTLQTLGGYLSTSTITTEPDLVAEISIYLRVASASEASTGGAVADDARGEEVILLVEDETAVRGVMARALRDRGYHVLEAQNGADALDVAADFASPIDLVVSDVVMPQMDGRTLFEQLRGWYPGIRFLFVSGYTRGALATAQLRSPVTDFLPKPFRMDVLADAVRRLLDRRKGEAAGE